jgi:hypothetical protein
LSEDEEQEEGRAEEEEVSRKVLRSAKDSLQATPVKRKGPGGIKGKKIPKFETLLEAYVKGATAEEMAERFGLKLNTVKNKLPALELAKVKFGIGKAQSSIINPTVPGDGVASSTSSGIVAGPPPAVSTPGTSMVPAGAQGTSLSGVQSKAGGAASSEGIEDGEEAKVPTWMKDDGRETVNIIEMAIRGVNSKETFSPITILLLSYLKYLG